MKSVLVGIAALALISCAQVQETTAPQTTIYYSGAFKMSLPTDSLNNGGIISFQEIGFKTADGNIFFGRPVSVESEELPSDFDITKFPIYGFGLESIPQDEDYSKQIERVAQGMNIMFDVKHHAQVTSYADLKIYTSCKDRDCIGYIVTNEVNDHILEIHYKGIEQDKFNTFIKGTLNADGQ